jgi:hypothetical protein
MKENVVREMLAHPIASLVIIGAVGSAVAGVVREIMKPSVMKISTSRPNYVANVARTALADAVVSASREAWKNKRFSKIEKDETESVVKEEEVEDAEEDCSDGE